MRFFLILISVILIAGCSNKNPNLTYGISISPSFGEVSVFSFSDSKISALIYSDYRIAKMMDTLYFVEMSYSSIDSIKKIFIEFSQKPNNLKEEIGVYDGCRILGYENLNSPYHNEIFNYRWANKSDTIRENLSRLHSLLNKFYSSDSVVLGYLNDRRIVGCFTLEFKHNLAIDHFNELQMKRYAQIDSLNALN
jgi:hypothetical protein